MFLSFLLDFVSLGKGGETIKRLQDAVCCKIIIVQDSHAVGASPKPLRIMGPPDAVARAKKMVEDILDSVDGGHGQVTISVSYLLIWIF
jgi:rRNA processing protein Krr1/Pno1